MADGGKEEKRYIGGFAKSLKKYGSTCNHMKTQEKLIKHTVSKSDTLQGIALKYGVTMEQIRRINRLWASDSLFLRENLLIPSADQQGGGEERELTTPELEAALLAAAQGSPLSPLEFRALPSGQDVSSPIMRECAAALSARDESRENDVSPPHEKSALQFLGEIDTSIAHTKNMVKKIQVSSNFREQEEEGGGLLGVVGGVVPHHASGKRRPLHSRLHPNHHGTAGLQHHRAAAAKMAHHNHNNNNNHQHVAGGGDKWPSSGGEVLVGSGTGGGYQSGAGYQSGVGGYQGGGGADPLPPVVLTQGKKVRSSMQRLEQEADEMFEL